MLYISFDHKLSRGSTYLFDVLNKSIGVSKKLSKTKSKYTQKTSRRKSYYSHAITKTGVISGIANSYKPKQIFTIY